MGLFNMLTGGPQPSRQATQRIADAMSRPPEKPMPQSTPRPSSARTEATARTAHHPNRGTTIQEAGMVRQLGATIQETHQRTGEALSLLHDLAAPPASETPSQITEILSALTAVLESQRKIEQQQEEQQRTLDRLLRAVQPRTV